MIIPHSINAAAIIFLVLVLSLKIIVPIKTANNIDVSLSAATKGIGACVMAQIATQYEPNENIPATEPTFQVVLSILKIFKPLKIKVTKKKIGTVVINNQEMYDNGLADILEPIPSKIVYPAVPIAAPNVKGSNIKFSRLENEPWAKPMTPKLKSKTPNISVWVIDVSIMK